MKILFLFLCIVMLAVQAPAQLKSQDEQHSASQSLVRPMTSIGNFLGLLNSDNFSMRHNIGFSYLSAGGQGISLASYTNSMFYKIADPLNMRVDLTLQGSPFGQYSNGLQQNDLNKFYLSRAEINYHPTDNLFIQFQYRQLPFSYYNGYSNGYYPYGPFDGPWGDQ